MLNHYFGEDEPRVPPTPAEPPAPIDEIIFDLGVVRRLVDELPAGPHSSRLSVAIEGAQAAAAAHPARKVPQ